MRYESRVLQAAELQGTDEKTFRQMPAHTITSSATVNLKNVSRVSSRLRALARSLLFAHTRHELRDQERFLDFLRQHELAPHVMFV
ncbi:hypothetical protein EMCG_03373 [[Emmonsia] crescens]|uniref:Uncharacterized protein n=1 Tax=[Emmonsia] crescens TaxID=73230 RepID=A0A0G2J092_9EURO|nr:hypothetical protein EMCG_03373 [Emmonsia crescens UAMH 3008]